MNVKPRLDIKGLTVFDEMGVKRLDDVTFTVNAGEVLGIAGIAGSGQRELPGVHREPVSRGLRLRHLL